ncbi:hypothetical protein PSMK_25930 [Phycisphaera mikurensis NBRC 102666]|uniref:Signaling protein n=2 Tax=Phycisphaera TaxID=666508 RepID=I0IHL4_PHYMF|nr:hypothetical protein PSMK_25930 [Phycisphaera mikurensis NBRC 102666]
MLAERLPRPRFLVVAVLTLTTLATGGLVHANRAQDAARHERLAEKLAEELQRRVEIYAHGLRGLRSAFAGSVHVSRAGFSRSVASQQPATLYPAAIGIGYAQNVLPADREAFLREVRADGSLNSPDAFASPPPADRPWLAMKYAEPEGPNATVLGQGLESEPRRRAAAERARDTGEPVLTATLRLRGDGAGTPGFLLLLGDYGHGPPPIDEAARRAAIRGWLMVALRADRLFTGAARVTDHELDFAVDELRPGAEPEVLYVAAATGPAAAAVRGPGSSTRTLRLGGRDWSIRTRPNDAFQAASHAPAVATAAGGSLLALVLGLLLRSQRTMLRHAHTLARTMTLDLKRAAMTDRLTGLPNRARIIDRIAQAMADARSGAAEGPRFAVFFLDFDRFKQVNDRLGHDAGDELLRLIGGRLRAALRSEDATAAGRMKATPTPGRRTRDLMAARLGGDEFVVLIEGLGGVADAEAVGKRLLDVLAPDYDIGGHTVRSTASVGVALGNAGHRDVAALLREADAAMYEAKRRAPGTLRVFDAEMREEERLRMQVAADLPRAAERAEMRLVYQPIVRTRSGGTESLEALVRWDHPELGSIPPDRFIPLAEASGQIIPLGAWILDRALEAYAGWRRDPRFPRDAALSVNLSRRQLADPGFCRTASTLLAKHGVPASRLHLEVTEREVMDEPEAALRTLAKLRAGGIRIDLDDFGTGQSSLAALHRFPLDVLKIDRAFVSGLGVDATRTAVFRGVLDLARTLRLEVVAEGIETPLQLEIATSLRCDFVQGFGLSRPLRPEDVPAFCHAAAGGLNRPRLAA